jgi:hypothetical protein
LGYSQSGDDPQEDLAKFGYQAKYDFFAKHSSINFWLFYVNPCIEVWRFLLKFDLVLALENLEKQMIL